MSLSKTQYMIIILHINSKKTTCFLTAKRPRFSFKTKFTSFEQALRELQCPTVQNCGQSLFLSIGNEDTRVVEICHFQTSKYKQTQAQ